MTGKPQTRKQLEAVIADVSASLGRAREEIALHLRELQHRTASEKEGRKLVDDLKQRLAIAEADNQRMRGYIARVQEDDVVREDLVKVGDPDGEHQLVPKRKPTQFFEPSPFVVDQAGCSSMMATDRYRPGAGNSTPPKHWVTY